MTDAGQWQTIYVLKHYLTFIALLVIGSLAIAWVLEDLWGWEKWTVGLLLMCWIIASWFIMIILEERGY